MYNIGSIQQVGLGSENADIVHAWYREHLGMNVQVFSEEAEAALMTKYTGGKVHSRKAILALNKFGGGGIEFWQFKSRKSEKVSFDILPGDLGISCLKMKVSNIEEAFTRIQKLGVKVYTKIGDDIMTPSSFQFQDPFGNRLQLVESSNWYSDKEGSLQGGVLGVSIGVSDLEKSVQYYAKLFNFDTVKDLKVETYKDLNKITGGKHLYRRAVLSHSKPRKGPFAKLLGANEIELIQVLDRTPNIIFKDRYWGDQGYIHLCFDVQNMTEMEKHFELTVDSANSFDMGKAAGRFSYTEDPDGTLIEFVETHKIPILPKIGWYYKLSKNKKEYVPDWLIKLMFFGSK
ncbi:VOC family protein [Portibacter lacus]|uniref:VOC domain-containing protein n=1 Tax=Portibacter lacus TaxID=1099794 RepID=A0AA37WIB8_9BACT|nr:VOC family protein [Portibacter lacus]GLR19635.1 hypothetical protein GCM10007940_42510 [Portibacter lacus]